MHRVPAGPPPDPMPFEDVPPASLELPAVRRPRARRLLVLVGGWTLYGLVFAALWTLTARSEPSPGLHDYRLHQLVLSLAPAWVWAACTPLVTRATRRATPERVGWARTLLAHAALLAGIALAVTAARRLVNLAFSPAGTATPFAMSLAFWADHIIFTYGVLVGVTRALDLHRRWLARARREIALQTELARTKLQFLRRQLQPHFLFNCLNATAELAREEPVLAQRMLRHLQRLLRAAFARSDAEEVPLRDELATLEPYVELQRMRFGDALRVERHVVPAALDARVPVFILQPLVENAIQHGLTARPGGGTIAIAADVADGRLRLAVRDDGNGAGEPRGERRGGIGLRNTRDRLAQLYGDAQRFELRHEPGLGTVAAIEIPFRPHAEAGRVSLPGEPLAALPAAGEPAPRASAADAPVDRLTGSAAEGDPMTTTGVFEASAARDVAAPRYAARTWLALTAFWVAMGGMWVLQNAARQLVWMGAVTKWAHTTIDFWTAMVWLALTPVALLLARRVRLTRRGWPRAVLVHAAAALALDVVHLAVLLRLVAALGLMERPLVHQANVSQFTLNIVIYAALVTWSHARDFSAWHRARVLAGARLDAALAQARWQTLALELRPDFLLAVLERVAQLAPADPARAERLVERLADFLRGTLDMVGRPTQPLRTELALLEECLDLHGEATARRVALTIDLPPSAMDRPVASGAFRALTNQLLAPDAPAELRLRVGAAARDGRLALRLTSSVPLRPDDASLGDVAFPDAATAELDLGPALAAAPDDVVPLPAALRGVRADRSF